MDNSTARIEFDKAKEGAKQAAITARAKAQQIEDACDVEIQTRKDAAEKELAEIEIEKKAGNEALADMDVLLKQKIEELRALEEKIAAAQKLIEKMLGGSKGAD